MASQHLVVLAFALALATPLSGCFTCETQLDMHHCRTETRRCDPTGDQVVDWNPDLRDLFPDVDRLLGSLASGTHGHVAWTPEQAEAFWSFYQVPADAPQKQIFLRHEGDLFHVRVLEC